MVDILSLPMVEAGPILKHSLIIPSNPSNLAKEILSLSKLTLVKIAFSSKRKTKVMSSNLEKMFKISFIHVLCSTTLMMKYNSYLVIGSNEFRLMIIDIRV